MNYERLLKGGMWLAIAVGAYARLHGLGVWPWALDEYFTARSVQNIIQHGVPAFACGGYYMRELILQYLIAPLFALGISPEFAARLVTVAFSFALLPAVYLLGKRLSGTTVACVSVALLSLSLWEIEFARFARMYVPFQAIFLWYLVALHRLVVDRRSAAHGWLWLLSLAGLFTWAGGLFLLVVNFLPGLIERAPGRARHLAVSAGLLLFGYWYGSLDFRFMGGAPPMPPDVPLAAGSSSLLLPPVLASTLLSYPIWAVVASGALLLSVAVAVALARASEATVRERVAWSVLIALSLLNLFGSLLVASILVLLLGWIDVRRASRLRILTATLPIAVNFLFWLAYAAMTDGWYRLFPGFGPGGELSKLVVVLFKYPNVFDPILFPWLNAVPALAVVLGGLLGLAGIWAISTRNDGAHIVSLRLVLVVVLTMIALVGVAETKYVKTRYTFFLLPVLYLVAVTAIHTLFVRPFRSQPKRGMAMAAALFVLVGWTEDFGWAHMVHMARMDWNYRLPLNAPLAEHYYWRWDYRTPAERVNRLAQPDDIIITTTLPVAFYLNRTDYVYRNYLDTEFASVSCDRGQRERWTGARLVYRKQNLVNVVDHASGNVWMIVHMGWRPPPERLLEKPYSAKLVYRGRAGVIGVYKISGSQ